MDPEPDDSPVVVIFARRYDSENLSIVQFKDYARWTERKDIDGTSAYRLRLDHEGPNSGWCIAVIDATGGRALREFHWRGEPHQLPEAQVQALIDRTEPFAGHPPARIHYGTAAGPRLAADGTWSFPAPQG